MAGLLILVLSSASLGQEQNQPTRSFERAAPDVGRALNRWYKTSSEVSSLRVDFLVRELSPEGKFSTEEPQAATFQFAAEPVRARLDIAQPMNPRAWVLSADGEWFAPESAAPRTANPLDNRTKRREYLWIGPLPAFLFLGQDPELLRDRFKLRLVANDKDELALYLYPQTAIDERHCLRIEAKLDSESMQPKEIHVVRRNGGHAFFFVQSVREEGIDEAGFRK